MLHNIMRAKKSTGRHKRRTTPPHYNAQFVAAVHTIMARLGIETATELARRCGIDQGNFSRWYNGWMNVKKVDARHFTALLAIAGEERRRLAESIGVTSWPTDPIVFGSSSPQIAARVEEPTARPHGADRREYIQLREEVNQLEKRMQELVREGIRKIIMVRANEQATLQKKKR